MKYLFKIITLILVEVLKSAIFSALLSAFFCFVTNKWSQFVWGGIVLFFVLFIYKSVFILIDMVRRIKYKEYDKASNMLGISYRNFKKLIKKH
jgi:uncharacterized membrane protein YagU involved in acid resistance